MTKGLKSKITGKTALPSAVNLLSSEIPHSIFMPYIDQTDYLF